MSSRKVKHGQQRTRKARHAGHHLSNEDIENVRRSLLGVVATCELVRSSFAASRCTGIVLTRGAQPSRIGTVLEIDDGQAPGRVERMAQEMRAAYVERMREIAARAETLPREIQELDARITRLHERLKAGDPDLAADELQAGIERAENKRRELLDARPTERENARVLGLMPRAAELYREQIDLGLGGDLAAAAKARTILRDMLGEIMLSPGEDGSL